MKFKTQLTYAVTPASYERIDGPSLTVEGESYTITELMRKHILGQAPNVAREAIYIDQDDDGYDIEKLRDSDLVERDEVKASNTLKIKELEEKVKPKKPEENKPAAESQESTITPE